MEDHGGVTVWVGLLRGVNVGGRGRLAMADLRRVVEGLGHRGVRTYVQSGNVVFLGAGRAGEARVAAELADAIAAATAVQPDVLLRSARQMAGVVAANPFLARGADEAHQHVVFLAEPAATALAGVDLARHAPEAAEAHGRELYLHLPGGSGRSKLAADLTRRGARRGTMRNWRTVTTLAAMAADIPHGDLSAARHGTTR